jgi:hypothetical protein
MSTSRPRTKSRVTLSRLPPKPPLSSVLSPKDDPFIAFPKGQAKAIRLRAGCPRKRLVFSAGKPISSKGPVPVLGLPLALLSPRTTPVSPRQPFPCSQDSGRLGPVKVRRKAVHLKKSESLNDLRRESVETPGFRQGSKAPATFKPVLIPGLAASICLWKRSALQQADPEVSFGH